MTIEELFGTLQQATVASWRKHLRTAKYAKHEALDEFYKELPEKVDALIEGYMGARGKKITKFENILKSSNMNTLKYLQELKKVCKQGYDLLDDNEELEGLLDDIVNLINSTLYKVKELAESHSYPDLADYINEALINEGMDSKKLTIDDEFDFFDYLDEYCEKSGCLLRSPAIYFDNVDIVDAETEETIPGVTADGTMTFKKVYAGIIKYFKKNYKEEYF